MADEQQPQDPQQEPPRPSRPRRQRAPKAAGDKAAPAPQRRRRTAAAAEQGGAVKARAADEPDPETVSLDPEAPGVPLDVNHELVPEGTPAETSQDGPDAEALDEVSGVIGERLDAVLASDPGGPGADAGTAAAAPVRPAAPVPAPAVVRAPVVPPAASVTVPSPGGVPLPVLAVGGGVLLVLLLFLLGRRRS